MLPSLELVWPDRNKCTDWNVCVRAPAPARLQGTPILEEAALHTIWSGFAPAHSAGVPIPGVARRDDAMIKRGSWI